MPLLKSLYALFVSINEYPNPRHCLEGCERDIQSMQEYLQTHFDNEECTFYPKVLTNQAATRNNIIQGFDHFQQAKDGDICLFHYAGHGSRCPAPKEFWHIEPDKMHETLVCYDSRTAYGRDLIDKELSYLIWGATKGKKLHFVVILDCCHSGTATRTQYHNIRQLKDRVDGLIIEQYLGFKYYKKTSDHKYSPPKGRHVLLAAAQDKQTAKEVYANGKLCGIFTYCLLDALKNAQHQISYMELMNRVRIRVKNKVSDQSPQLESTQASDKNLFFLYATPSSEGISYLAAYDVKKRDWVLNAGALHGIHVGDGDFKTILELSGKSIKINVKEVYPNYSILEGMQGFSKKDSFKARLVQLPSPHFAIAFDRENELIGEQYIRAQLDKKLGVSFHIVSRPEKANYLLHAKYGYFFLCKLDENIPKKIDEKHPLNSIRSVFKKIKGYSVASAIEFLNSMEKVNRWIQVLELSHRGTSIKDSEIQVQFFRTLKPSNYDEDDVEVEELNWKIPSKFPYLQNGVEWCKPAFQLKVKNMGKRPLWVSLLYFGDDFSITNQLIAKQALNPGEEVWALDIFDGHPYRNIPLKMEDVYHSWGITDINEYLKLFICTEEFSTDDFNQNGLKLDQPDLYPERNFGRWGTAKRSDWATKEISLTIHRPLNAKKIRQF